MALRLSRRARRDLDEIWEYVFLNSSSDAIADRQLELIGDGLRLLIRWPRIGRARDELQLGMRSLTVGDYLIFHRIARGHVMILRVLHGRRDLARLMRRR